MLPPSNNTSEDLQPALGNSPLLNRRLVSRWGRQEACDGHTAVLLLSILRYRLKPHPWHVSRYSPSGEILKEEGQGHFKEKYAIIHYGLISSPSLSALDQFIKSLVKLT